MEENSPFQGRTSHAFYPITPDRTPSLGCQTGELPRKGEWPQPVVDGVCQCSHHSQWNKDGTPELLWPQNPFPVTPWRPQGQFPGTLPFPALLYCVGWLWSIPAPFEIYLVTPLILRYYGGDSFDPTPPSPTITRPNSCCLGELRLPAIPISQLVSCYCW